MLKRKSIVRNIVWESEDTRDYNKTMKADFIGKCQILYPAFKNFLLNKRKEGDESNDEIRRSLYDKIIFRKNDNLEFIEAVLNTVAKKAFEANVLPGLSSFEQYFAILAQAYKEAKLVIRNNQNKNE